MFTTLKDGGSPRIDSTAIYLLSDIPLSENDESCMFLPPLRVGGRE
jgi:hypothetical protein